MRMSDWSSEVCSSDLSVENCVLKMNLDKPEAGPVAEARKQLVMLRQFVVDKKLVSIPSDELALVNEAPPFNRWNSAYLDIPGPSDQGMPSTYYTAQRELGRASWRERVCQDVEI